MGANQSTVAANGHIKESLYDVLQVQSDADATTLKKAYRQRALELHPDRNFSNEEAATAMFARVQTAYDILTDPKEREWYDNHRKSGAYDTYDGGITTAADVKATLARELRGPSSKSPFDFDRVAAHFEKLKHEEQEAAFEQDISPPAVNDAPPFGTRTDSWADALRFYNSWSSFATIKSYAWEDIYPSHLATDRKTRRKFDQHNKRVRDAGKREFNAAVRYAVSTLRQADPRRPSEPPRQSKPPNPSQRPKTMEVAEFVAQDWQQTTEVESLSNEGEILECIVCDERFETIYDQQDHEKSALHRRTLEALKSQLLKDEELLNVNNSSTEGALAVDDVSEKLAVLSAKDEEPSKKAGKAKAKAKRKQKGNNSVLLTCGTCGGQFGGEALMEHKRLTRHP